MNDNGLVFAVIESFKKKYCYNRAFTECRRNWGSVCNVFQKFDAAILVAACDLPLPPTPFQQRQGGNILWVCNGWGIQDDGGRRQR